MSSEPTVYIVDDEPGVRKVLRLVVETAGLRGLTFESAEDFLQSLEGNESGCVLLDFRLGGMSGLQLLEQLRERNSALVAIMITGHAEVAVAVDCMKMGAMDFLEKPPDTDQLLVTIEEALARSESVRLTRAQTALGRRRLTSLTEREHDILTRLVAGKSSKQIAGETKLSLKTVSNHRAHLLAKTGAGNTAELVRIAVIAQLVNIPHNLRRSGRRATNTHQ